MSSIQLPVLIIPAYNPDNTLITLLQSYKAANPDQQCIIVDDGSIPAAQVIFTILESQGYLVLRHDKNLGKGAALKTAMHYYLAHFANSSPGVVTADADGQHSVTDIQRLSFSFIDAPLKLHLGVRDVAKAGIPLRSRMGNTLTRFLYNLFTRNNIKDTQTGLRAIPNALIQKLLNIESTRYEFEFEMFFVARKFGISIHQIPIETIYIDHNKGSHFNPLIDSLKIYYVFLRFCAVGLSSFALDFSLFCFVYHISHYTAWSVFLARVVTVPYNFFLNKNLSFKSDNSLLYAATMYGLLAIVLGVSSYQVMHWIHYLGLNIYLSKIMAECIIFTSNFLFQYWVVFAQNKLAREQVT